MFYNPKITHPACTIEGVPNQLFSSGMLPYQHCDEVRKAFGGGRLNCKVVNEVNKVDQLADVDVGEYLTTKYVLWLDLRTPDDDTVHGSSRAEEHGSEGIMLQLTKKQESAGAINMYVFIVTDAQLNITESRRHSVVH